MTAFAAKRCFVHPGREAASFCMACRRPFCRECVTEHDGRLTCASCIAKLDTAESRRTQRFARLGTATSVLAAVAFSWLFFYMLGRACLLVEPSRHAFQQPAEDSAR